MGQHFPSRHLTHRPHRAGFSLVEVLMIIVIMGMLGAIAFSRVDLSRMQLRSAVQILSTTMVAAQREAITKQHDMILTFDATNRIVRVTWDANNNNLIDVNERRRTVALEDRVRFGRSFTTARWFGSAPINFNRSISGLPALIFHRNGSASGVGGFYLTSARAVTDSRWVMDTRAVEIVRATGRTEWFRYDGTAWKRGF